MQTTGSIRPRSQLSKSPVRNDSDQVHLERDSRFRRLATLESSIFDLSFSNSRFHYTLSVQSSSIFFGPIFYVNTPITILTHSFEPNRIFEFLNLLFYSPYPHSAITMCKPIKIPKQTI